MCGMGDDALKSDDRQTGWVDLYHSALLEVDYQKLPERVKRAEDAINVLLTRSGNSEEMSAIRDALRNLRVLQKELDAHRTTERISHWHPEIDGDYVVFVDANRRYVEVSDAVCRLLGYSREELLAMTIDDVTAPELRSLVPETFREYVTQGELEGDYSLVAKDGSQVPIHYRSRVYPDGCHVARWKPLDRRTQHQLPNRRKDQAS